MGVDVAHLVLETLGDANDQVVDEGADGSECGDIFSVAVVDLDADDVLGRVGKVNGQMAQVLRELAYVEAIIRFPARPDIVDSG
jgi:hypothetical protein